MEDKVIQQSGKENSHKYSEKKVAGKRNGGRL